MAGGSGGAAASNNAHGWARVARQAVEMMQLRAAKMGPGKEVDELGEQEGPRRRPIKCSLEYMRRRRKKCIRWEEEERRKTKRCELIKKRKRNRDRNRTKKGRRNARQKRWAAKFLSNLDPGVCKREFDWKECEAFPSKAFFKVDCGGVVERYCAESEEACKVKHMKNFGSIIFAPTNWVGGLGKIAKGLKVTRKLGKAAAIREFNVLVKQAGKEIFRKYQRTLRKFMREEVLKGKLGEFSTETMDAIMTGGALEFAEAIARKENSHEAWLREVVEFADPTGLAEVWRTFESQKCAETFFPEMPDEDLEYETVAEAEGGEENDEEC